jgi:putative transposase
MCRVLKVSRGGYYAWLSRPLCQREKENQILTEKIKVIHQESKMNYGSPRITSALLDEKIKVSRPRVARIMRKNKIVAKTHRKFKITTNSKHSYSISPNLLKQDFTADQPGQVWASDITYIPTFEGWLYLTVIIDLFNRQVVGWSMSNSMRASDTTIPALEHAYNRFRPSPNLIFHSDRGVQYACNEFRKKISNFCIIQSMSGKGNCYDNAVSESFFSTLKKELIYSEKYKTRQSAKQAIFEYIEIFYNRKRKHSFLGNMSPEQFLKSKKAA